MLCLLGHYFLVKKGMTDLDEKQPDAPRGPSKEQPEVVIVNGYNWYIFMEMIELAMLEKQESTIH